MTKSTFSLITTVGTKRSSYTF